MAVIFAAVTGAILWNYTTWWLRLPTSSSHALIGGLVGAGLAKGGLEAIKASSVQKAVVFLVVSPNQQAIQRKLNAIGLEQHEGTGPPRR